MMASGHYQSPSDLVLAALQKLEIFERDSIETKTPAKPRSTFGCMKGTGRILGDIMQPIPEEDWWSGDDNL
jgi:hypothetical protein